MGEPREMSILERHPLGLTPSVTDDATSPSPMVIGEGLPDAFRDRAECPSPANVGEGEHW